MQQVGLVPVLVIDYEGIAVVVKGKITLFEHKIIYIAARGAVLVCEVVEIETPIAKNFTTYTRFISGVECAENLVVFSQYTIYAAK